MPEDGNQDNKLKIFCTFIGLFQILVFCFLFIICFYLLGNLQKLVPGVERDEEFRIIIFCIFGIIVSIIEFTCNTFLIVGISKGSVSSIKLWIFGQIVIIPTILGGMTFFLNTYYLVAFDERVVSCSIMLILLLGHLVTLKLVHNYYKRMLGYGERLLEDPVDV